MLQIENKRIQKLKIIGVETERENTMTVMVMIALVQIMCMLQDSWNLAVLVPSS